MSRNSRFGWCATSLVSVIVVLSPAAPAGAGPARSAADTVTSSMRDAIIRCTNRERARHRLRPLRESRPLRRAAQYHAQNMLRYRFFSHDDPFGRGPSARIAIFKKNGAFAYVGENIAAGYRSAQEACGGWLKSPGHRANILDRRYTRIGVGFVDGSRGYRTYFVQNFGGGLSG